MEQPSLSRLSNPKGEFWKPSSLSNPFLTASGEPLPAFKAMVRTQLFSRTISEDPGDHLRVFEGLCSSLVIPGMTQEAVRWKLFPFSLTERAEQWYTRMIGSMSGDWEELRDDFCYSLSLTECIDSLPTDILDFEQLEEESIGAAWARLLRLLASSPDLSLPDDVSLNIFCSGLDMESALKLDITAGGSFAQIIPTEGREILDFLLANSSFPTTTMNPSNKSASRAKRSFQQLNPVLQLLHP